MLIQKTIKDINMFTSFVDDAYVNKHFLEFDEKKKPHVSDYEGLRKYETECYQKFIDKYDLQSPYLYPHH